MIGLLCFLLTVVLFGSLGVWLAGKAGIPVVVGVVIGALFNAFGCVLLLGVWGAEWIIAQSKNLS